MIEFECMTYFAITGNFKLNDISKILNIKNTDGHSIGDKKTYGKGNFDYASWEYGTDYEKDADLNEQADRIVSAFTDKIDELKEIKDKYNCKFLLENVQKTTTNNPGISFNKKIIDFCSLTGTEIDVDIYVNVDIENLYKD